MLNDSRVQANIPASDLKRARDFYADKLGLTPVEEFEGVQLTYRTAGGTTFHSLSHRVRRAGRPHPRAMARRRHRVAGP
jgi:catechol 2,3-dioxygenase-like lactoylglutathione lyase family enzyme